MSLEECTSHPSPQVYCCPCVAQLLRRLCASSPACTASSHVERCDMGIRRRRNALQSKVKCQFLTILASRCDCRSSHQRERSADQRSKAHRAQLRSAMPRSEQRRRLAQVQQLLRLADSRRRYALKRNKRQDDRPLAAERGSPWHQRRKEHSVTPG